jgi:carbon-monoxide dehydrogenase medium subunit
MGCSSPDDGRWTTRGMFVGCMSRGVAGNGTAADILLSRNERQEYYGSCRGGAGLKPAAFAYAKARSVEHAVTLLGEHRDSARVLAGGQSLIATLNMRLDAPKLLVDINAIAGLAGIARKNGALEIGAMVRHASAMASPVLAEQAPLIAMALPHIGHPAIRNRGTIGGSIAFADPAAELPACLLALGGEAEIVGASGARTVKADDFFKGLFETVIASGEVLTAIRVRAATPQMRYGFAELSRRHGDYALVGLAASARADGKSLNDVRLVFFGVGSTPVRARGAEAALVGGDLEAAIASLNRDLDPEGDIHASGKAKKHMAGVLLKRVAEQLQRPRP